MEVTFTKDSVNLVYMMDMLDKIIHTIILLVIGVNNSERRRRAS